ncbi:MAG: glycosyltransferase [Ardenticatenaceae bacterium]|nr:glycosyltransferase [Ardenticatenaceae bacterium]
MFLTILVCTRDRPAQLQRCLSAIQPQMDGQSELLVVASAPSTPQEQQISEALGVGFVHEPRPGLDVARNRGIRHAKGEVIAFIDDDVLVTEDWLVTLRRAFADPSVACVTGRVLPVSLATAVQQQFEARFGFDRGTEPIRFTASDDRPWFPIHPYHLGTGGNMAFRRHVFDRVGLFDEALDAGTPTGGGGDLDMFRRLLLAGFTAVYHPDLLVCHEHRAAAAAARKQFYGYGKAFSALMTKVWLEEPTLKRQVPRLVRQQAILLLRLIWQRLRKRSVVTLPLLWLEALGNVTGPFAYLRARQRAKSSQVANLPAAQIVSVQLPLTESELSVPAAQDALVVFQNEQGVVGSHYLAAPGAAVSAERLKKLAPIHRSAAHDNYEKTATPAPSVAVVICTRNRPAALRNCLQSLVPFRDQLAQLIVVENSKDDAQTAVLAKQFSAQLEVEPEPGLCRARNRGLAAAKAEIVAYLDDDVVVDDQWLTRLTAVYQQNPQVAGVMGLVLPAALQTPDQHLFERALGGLNRGFVPRWFVGKAARTLAPQVGVGANMSFRRHLLQQIGGFDEALDPGTRAQAGGDIDIFYQFLKAGHTLLYDPALLVWHTHRREAGAAHTMSAAYGRGTAAAYAKWASQGDLAAGRMLLGYWLRYHPGRLWAAFTRDNLLLPTLAWAGWRASWAGPWAYFRGQKIQRSKQQTALKHQPVAVPRLVEGDSYGR